MKEKKAKAMNQKRPNNKVERRELPCFYLILRNQVEILRFSFSTFFPECVAKGSRLTWESEGRAVFAGRCFPVRNRSQPSATVRKCSNPAPMALPLGRALKCDFSWTCHVSVCAAIPL